MAVIRELRTRFTAEAKALKKAFQSIQKDATALAKSNKVLNDSFKKTSKEADTTTKRFEKASGQVYALNKSLDETPKVAKRVDKSINAVNKGVYNLNKSFSDTPVVAKRLGKGIDDVGKSVTNVNKGITQTPKVINKASDSIGAMNKNVYTLNKNFSDTPKTAKRAVTGVSSVRRGLGEATTQTSKFNRSIGGIRTHMATAGKSVTSTVSNMRNSLSSIPPIVSSGAITTRKSIMSGIVSPFREATNVVKGYAAVLGLLSAGTLASTGMARLSAIENAQVSLEVMMGDAERAKGFLDDVLDFAKTTPFAFPDLAETARNLVAFGMDEAKVIPTMKAIGDAAAGSGKGAEGLNQVASAFGDMQVSGTLSMDQINRLADAGVPALKILANQTGLSVDEMKKEISSGTMSSVQAIDDLVEGMQEGTDGVAGATASMGGLMEKMKDTWVGSVDSMKSSISSGMANLMEPLKVPIQDFMKWFGDSFGIMVAGILSFFEMMGPAAEPLKRALSDLRGFMQSLGRTVKNLFQALQPVASLVGMTLVGVFTVLAQVLKSVIAPTLEYISGLKIFAPIIAGIVTYIIAYRSALIAAMAIQRTGNAITAVSIALAKAQRAAHLAMVVSGGGVRGMLLAMNAAMRALNLTMLKNPFVLVAVLLVSLGAALYTAYKRSETFQNAVSKAFKIVKDAAVAVADGVVYATRAVGSFFAGVGKSIGDWFNNSLLPILSSIVSSVGEIGSEIADWFMTRFISSLSNALSSVEETGRSVATSLGKGINQGFQAISDTGSRLSGALSTSVSNSIALFSSVGEKISDAIAAGLNNKVGELVKGYFESVKESFQSVSGIAAMIAPTLIGIGSRMLGLTGPIGLVISIVITLISTFVRLYKSSEEVRSFVQSAWEGIQSVLSDVWKSIQPILDEFRKAFSEITKELGPEFAKTKEIITESINELKPTFQELGATFAELGKTFADLFKEIGKVVGDLIKEIVPIWIELQLTLVTTIGELVTVVIPSLLEVFKTVIPMILDIIKSFAAVYVEIFSMIIDVVLEIAKTVLPMLLSVFKAVIPIILDVVKAVLPLVMSLFTALIDVVLELVKTVVPMILSVVKAVLPMALTIVKAVLNVAISIFTMLIDVVMELVKSVLPMILSVVKSVFPMILSVIKTVLPIVINLITSVVSIILELAKTVIPLVLKIVQMVFPVIQKIIEVAMKVVVTVLKSLVAIIQNVVVPAIEFILKVVQTVFPVITKVIEGALNIVIGILDFFVALFTGNWSGMWDAIKKILNGALSIVWSVIKGAFDLISLFIKTIFTAISKFFSAIWSGITKIFKTVISAIYNFVVDRFAAVKNRTTTIFTAVWNFLKNIWNTVLNFIIGIVTNLYNRFVSGWKNIYNNTKIVFTNVWNFIKDIWNRVKNFLFNTVSNIFTRVKNTWNDLKTRTTEIFTGIYDAVKGKFDDIVDAAKKLPGRISDGIKSMASKVKEGVKDVVNTMGGLLEDGLNGVIGGINWVLNKIGVSESGQINEVTIPEFAKGGKHKGGLMIVGDGGKQELIQTPDGRTMLSPDTDTLVNAPKGTSILSGEDTEKFLTDIPKYKSGNSSISDIAKNAWGATKRGANKVKDVAVDAGKAVGRGAKIAGEKVVEWSGNVWDYVKKPGKLLDIALKTLGVEMPKGGSFIGDIAKAGFNKIKNGAVDFIKEKMTSFDFDGAAPNINGGASAWRPLIQQAAARMGESITDAQVNGIIAQIQRESGGNQKIVQSSAVWDVNTAAGNPARGLLQYIPQTFSAYKVPGHGNIYSGYDQLLAFFNNKNWRSDLPYGKSGWGPSGARKYANGGIVNTKQLAWIADGGWAESIISHDPSKKVRQQRIWQETGDRLGFTDDKSNKEILFELKRIAKAVENGDEYIVRAINEKPVLTEGDIKRSYDKRDSHESINHAIFTGRPGGA